MPEVREAQLVPDLSQSTVQGVTGASGQCCCPGFGLGDTCRRPTLPLLLTKNGKLGSSVLAHRWDCFLQGKEKVVF